MRLVPDVRLRQLQPGERLGGDRRAELRERRRPARGGRLAGAKRSRAWNVAETRLSLSSSFGQLDRGLDPAQPLGGGEQEAVVGPT